MSNACYVTLSDAITNVLEVWSCNVIGQTEAVPNISPWMEEYSHWFVSVRRESSIQAKLRALSPEMSVDVI